MHEPLTGRVGAVVAMLAASAVLAAPLAAGAATHTHAKTKHPTHKKATKKHKAKPKKKKKAKKTSTAPAVAPAAPTQTCTTAVPGAPSAATDAFLAHLKAAHLDTGVQEQVTAITSDLDGYVRIHTVLVENMLDPSFTDLSELPPALYALVQVFADHLNAAHLEVSPLDQVKQILDDPDGYVRLHTVLIENMVAPLSAWAAKYMNGTAAQCTAAPSTSTPAPAAGTQAVAISGMAFKPADVTVASGSTVTWTNDDEAPHTVTSMHGGSLKSGTLNKGGTYSYTFTTPGTYMYVCDVHPDMKGTVTVK